MAKSAKHYLDCEAKLESDKGPWKIQWQLVSEYVHQRRADFTSSKSQGAFISSQLWTDVPVHMAETSASAFLGYVWSAGEHSFKLRGNEKIFGKDREMQEFWSDATKTLQEEMGDPEAGLASALDESMLDLIVLGTDAIFTEERNTDKPQRGCLSFEPWTVLEFSLKENAAGRATVFYRRTERSVAQHVEKFKIDKVSQRVRDLYNRKQYDDKVQVLHVVEPRLESERTEGSQADKDMPIASVHIEIESKHVCRDSGYPEHPVACTRLAKRIKEPYGRGRAMNALPSIMMLNQVYEDYMLAQEGKLDPPFYTLNDSVTGNVIDRSPGANNVLRVDKSAPNIPPVGKLFDIQDTNDVAELIERLQNEISNHFMIDRLINMNNDREMTARETTLRNAIRQSTLRSPVSRMLMEKFTPIINTSFMICLRRGKFGYMPNDPVALARERAGEDVKYLPKKFIEAMQTGADLYAIDYMTPAARDRMAEESQGMMETLEVAGQLAQFDNTIPAYLDSGWILTRLAETRGADNKMFKKDSEARATIQRAEEAQAQANQAQIAQAQAGVAKDQAMAQSTNALQ